MGQRGHTGFPGRYLGVNVTPLLSHSIVDFSLLLCVFLNTSGVCSEGGKEGRQRVFPDATSLGAEGRVSGDGEQGLPLSL